MTKAKRKPGRPDTGIVSRGTHVATYLGTELTTALRKRKEKTGVPVSEMVRRAIAAYLKKK